MRLSRGHQEKKEQGVKGLRPLPEEKLGSYIRRLRLIRGLNLSQVAVATASLPGPQRLSQSYLSQIELGQVFQPSRERLQTLAQILKVPEEWLLERADPTGSPTEMPTGSNPVLHRIAFRAAQLGTNDQALVLLLIDAIQRARRQESD